MKKLSLNNNLISKIKGIFFPFYKSKEALKIFDTLEKDQPKNKKVAMFVGGCVRKALSGEEIDDIGAVNPILYAFGNDTYAILEEYLGDEFVIKKLMHYSHYISKEKYREKSLFNIRLKTSMN